MATPQDYTSMPWAPRSNIAQEDDSPTPLRTATPNTQALIEQLAASHALQRQQESRIRELLSKQHDLSKELEHGRKRETAVQAVFVENLEREQELAKRERVVEEKMKQLNKQEEYIVEKEKSTNEKVKEVMQLQKALGHHTPSTSKLEADRVRQKAGVNYLGLSDYAHCSFSRNTAHLDTDDFHISAAIMNGQDVQTLRRHDYYIGNYSCSYQNLMKEWEQTQPKVESFPYLNECLANPESNGRNAGALFTFAALCANHKPEWDMRLDKYTWPMECIESACGLGGDDRNEAGFWHGFAEAKEEMKAKFERMLEKEA
ncbi:hypothetical protein HBI47_096670 [Parastagonospora nodorum]|nr:hypothetical protein HBI47_096670 [Parastagonospora nodorum]